MCKMNTMGVWTLFQVMFIAYDNIHQYTSPDGDYGKKYIKTEKPYC